MAKLLRTCLVLLAAGSAVLTSACATVTNGKDQSMKFETDPSEAECTLMQSNTQIAKFKTPTSVVVRRANSPLTMACTKEGYYETRALIDNTFTVGAWGNLVVGGLIGVVVDTQTGAAYRYYDPPRFTMIAGADTPPQVSQTVSPGITLLPPEGPPTGPRAPTAAPAPAAPLPQTVTTAAPAAASPASRPVASTVTGAPAPIAPASGLSRSRL